MMTEFLLGLALFFAALLVLGIATELSCRLWFRYGARIYVWPPFYHVEMDVDSNILPNLPPHARFQANRLGARGDEPPARHINTFRILMCGGSGVECFALDQTKTWAHLVQEFLSQPEHRKQLGVEQVHVANLGKSGITTDALCYALPSMLPRFAPLDVLTIMNGTGAVNYWTKVGTPSQLPEPDPPWADLEWHSEHAWSWKPKKTAVAELVRRVSYRLRKPVVVRKGVGKRLGKSREMRRNAREVRDTFGDPTQWLQSYENSLSRVVEIARPYARRIVLIRQPWFDKLDPTPEESALFWHGSVGDAYVEFADTYYSHRVLCTLMQLVDEATVRVGDKLGLAVLQPAEVIKASTQTYYDHFHLTALGASVMGEYVGRRLLEVVR